MMMVLSHPGLSQRCFFVHLSSKARCNSSLFSRTVSSKLPLAIFCHSSMPQRSPYSKKQNKEKASDQMCQRSRLVLKSRKRCKFVCIFTRPFCQSKTNPHLIMNLKQSLKQMNVRMCIRSLTHFAVIRFLQTSTRRPIVADGSCLLFNRLNFLAIPSKQA